jgi:hypothetical protein
VGDVVPPKNRKNRKNRMPSGTPEAAGQ